ncbi:hypothetical protein U9M48_037069 [Paspalum notatum var. saurae]|uniref:Protein kinase domain-containing protein n=1 Tax=Paspalum notatum var. saurae TaxID=547442 RepID=A0AAQ3XC18_PASNO
MRASASSATLLPLLTVAALVSVSPPWLPAADAAYCGEDQRCGSVEIHYPFGIGRGCYLDTGDGSRAFEVSCNRANGTATVDGGWLELLHIDLTAGKLRVRSRVSSACYNATSGYMDDRTTWPYNSTAFRVSDADNVITVVGCDTLGYIGSQEGAVENRYVMGCNASCPGRGAPARRPPVAAAAAAAACDGTDGCCRTTIQKGISSFDFGFTGSNENRSDGLSPCGYAFLVERNMFKFRETYDATTSELKNASRGGGREPLLPLVLDWAVGNLTCAEAEAEAEAAARKNKTRFACVSENSVCVNSTNGLGYLCNCSIGYRGNPYIEHGCKGTSVGVVVVSVVLSCTYAIQEKKRLAAIKQRYFKQHGGLLLFEELKSQARQGRGQQVRSFTIFTKTEVEEATGRFDERHVLGKGGNGTVYRGALRDGRAVAIKRCRVAADERQRREFGKEVLILSQVNHRNIV